MSRISVIVAAYNVEKYIRRCIESLLNQSYEDLEIIVVDDGSLDETGKILDEYAKMSSKIRVIHQDNMGLSGARNTGLKVATGDYIGYVDGDDYVSPDMYRLLIKAILDKGSDVSVCAYKCVSEDDDSVNNIESDTNVTIYDFDRDEALDIYICDNREFHIYNSVWSKLFSRKTVENLWFAVGKKSEDIMYTTEAFLRASKISFVDASLYYYVVDRSGSLMNSALGERRFNDEIPFLREQLLAFKERTSRELYHKSLYHFYRRLLFYYVDFNTKKMGVYARKLAKYIKTDKEEALESVSYSFVKEGDRVRMKLFLLSPKLYYLTVYLYERMVLPIRNRK